MQNMEKQRKVLHVEIVTSYDLHTRISVKHSAKPDPMHLSNFKFTKKNNLTKKTYSKEC